MSHGDASLAIRGARVLALDDADHDWPHADVVVEGGRIAAIGPDAARDWPRPLARTIDALLQSCAFFSWEVET